MMQTGRKMVTNVFFLIVLNFPKFFADTLAINLTKIYAQKLSDSFILLEFV